MKFNLHSCGDYIGMILLSFEDEDSKDFYTYKVSLPRSRIYIRIFQYSLFYEILRQRKHSFANTK